MGTVAAHLVQQRERAIKPVVPVGPQIGYDSGDLAVLFPARVDDRRRAEHRVPRSTVTVGMSTLILARVICPGTRYSHRSPQGI